MASLVLIAPPPTSISSHSLTHASRFSFSKSQSLGTSLSSASLSVATFTSPTVPSVYCGRGDRKTARGKRFNHSFGNARPRNKNKGRGPPKVPVTPSPPRKDKFEDDEVIKIEIDESLLSG
ncbi:30S ribosomal protein S31, chloroplastic [Fagus crenata]